MRKLRLRQVKSLAPVYTASKDQWGFLQGHLGADSLLDNILLCWCEAFRDTGLWEILPSVGSHVRASEGGQQSSHSLTGKYLGRKDQNLTLAKTDWLCLCLQQIFIECLCTRYYVRQSRYNSEQDICSHCARGMTWKWRIQKKIGRK